MIFSDRPSSSEIRARISSGPGCLRGVVIPNTSQLFHIVLSLAPALPSKVPHTYFSSFWSHPIPPTHWISNRIAVEGHLNYWTGSADITNQTTCVDA